MLIETIEERLQWFKDSCVESSNHQIIVIEGSADGYAEIVCDVSDYSILFKMEKFALRALRNRTPKNHDKEDSAIQCADAIIFVKQNDGHWKLHIMECKKSVSEGDKWKDIREQFEGALLNAYALMGILGIQELSGIHLYTALRTDHLTNKLQVSPYLLKAQGRDGRENRNIEWLEDSVNVLSLGNVPHMKIKLDEETGKGQVQLV